MARLTVDRSEAQTGAGSGFTGIFPPARPHGPSALRGLPRAKPSRGGFQRSHSADKREALLALSRSLQPHPEHLCPQPRRCGPLPAFANQEAQVSGPPRATTPLLGLFLARLGQMGPHLVRGGEKAGELAALPLGQAGWERTRPEGAAGQSWQPWRPCLCCATV